MNWFQFAVEALTAIIVDSALVRESKVLQTIVHRTVSDLPLLDKLPESVVDNNSTPSPITVQLRGRYHGHILGCHQHRKYADCAV